MAKLIITEKQYNAILEHVKQLKISINESEKAVTIDLTILLALGTLLGFNITGHNKIKAEKALKDQKTFEGIKDILSSENKIKELISSFEIKGMPDPTKKLFDDKGNFLGINSSGLRKDIADNVGYTIKSSYVLNLLDILPQTIALPSSTKLQSLQLTEQVKEITKCVVLVKVK